MIRKKYLAILACAATLAGNLTSCSKDDPQPDDPTGPLRKTVLLYAVASNNLASNLTYDKNEILQAAEKMDLRGLSLLVYEVTNQGNPRLLELKRNSQGETKFEEVKSYDREIYSTDPRRINEVITDVRNLRTAESYGLILWSHGLGWSPFFSERDEHGTRSLSWQAPTSTADAYTPTKLDKTLMYSFGADSNNGYTDKIDIDELGAAIPDGMFEYIWFDACMMSGIETIYELRDKCSYFGGYPTEVYNPGMPYHLTLPYLLREKSDLTSCARVFFNYYANSSLPTATVAVVDMSKLEDLADYCREAYSGATPPSASGMQYYSGSQRVAYPFYDLGQYTKAMAASNPAAPDIQEFDRIMDQLVIFKAATPYDFISRPIDPAKYSGISCHLYRDTDTDRAADYYRTLSWYERVY